MAWKAPWSRCVVAEAGRVRHRVEHAALALLEGQGLAQREGRLAGLGAGGDRAVRADDRRQRGVGGEPVPAGAVGHRRAGEPDRQVGRGVRQCRVELGQGGQPVLAELVDVEAADRGDEPAVADAARPGPVGRLHVRDRVRVLQRGVVTGPVAHQHDVVVAVDDAGDRGPPAQVDQPRLVLEPVLGRVDVVAGVHDPALADRDDADHPVAVVHRVDPAVVQDQVGPERALRAVSAPAG